MNTLKKILAFVCKPLRWIRSLFISRLLKLRTKLQISSLRTAIVDADKNKDKTGRKNMVVFNAHKGVYEPFQKRQLKIASKKNKNTNNAALTSGRLKMKKRKKKRILDPHNISTIEKKSLYVTN